MRVRHWARRHPKARRAIFAGLVVAVVGAVLLWLYVRSYESTDDAQVDGYISSLGVRIFGIVTAVHVDANQRVKAGQLLVEIDPSDYRVALARAEAELAQAQAQLQVAGTQVPITAETTRTTTESSSEDVTTARAAVAAASRDHEAAMAKRRQAEVENVRAQTDRQRAEALVANEAISRQQYDAQVAAARASDAAVRAALAEEHAARKAVEQQHARVAQAEARSHEASTNAPRQVDVQRSMQAAREATVRADAAALERARLDLSYARISAPFDGIIGRRAVEVGDAVQPGQTLVTVVPVANLWITANFKETQLEHLRPGQRARIHVDAFDRKFWGTVESIGAATGARFSLFPPENATGNYVKIVQRLPVRIRLDPNPDVPLLLRPGMSVVPKVWVR